MGITTNGAAQLHVSANNIRHRQVLHITYRVAISRMCSAIWVVWGGVCMGRDLAMCRWWGTV
jgi:hypothetical protein